jgi:hypothetical protein
MHCTVAVSPAGLIGSLARFRGLTATAEGVSPAGLKMTLDSLA